jgi:hypothetical protein
MLSLPGQAQAYGLPVDSRCQTKGQAAGQHWGSASLVVCASLCSVCRMDIPVVERVERCLGRTAGPAATEEVPTEGPAQ